jgi:hypothetical protein
MHAATSVGTPGLPPSPLKLRDVLRACNHQREVTARRIPRHRDLLRVDAKLAGVGAHPSQRGLDVVDLRWPPRLRSKPVLTRDRRVPDTTEQDAVAAKLRSIALDPSTSMHEQHPRAVRHPRGRRIDVGEEITVTAAADDNSLLDGHASCLLLRHSPLLSLRLNTL